MVSAAKVDYSFVIFPARRVAKRIQTQGSEGPRVSLACRWEAKLSPSGTEEPLT